MRSGSSVGSALHSASRCVDPAKAVGEIWKQRGWRCSSSGLGQPRFGRGPSTGGAQGRAAPGIGEGLDLRIAFPYHCWVRPGRRIGQVKLGQVKLG